MTPAQAVTSADLSKVHIDSVIPLPATGMQAIQNNGQIVFVSANGRFVIRGELTDVWQKKSLTNINAIKDAATHLHLRGMGLEPNDLNRVRIGHGEKEVVIFVDPLCPHCHELMKKATTELGDELPQAFFVANDTLAIGGLRALQEANIAVPDRVSLISFNDTPLTKQVFPALSSITVYTEEMGRTAVDILNRQLIKRHTVPTMTRLATNLTLRDSTK